MSSDPIRFWESSDFSVPAGDHHDMIHPESVKVAYSMPIHVTLTSNPRSSENLARENFQAVELIDRRTGLIKSGDFENLRSFEKREGFPDAYQSDEP